MLLLLVGAAMGPLGLNVLSAQALSVLDPAMPVALVALGVLVGFAAIVHRPGERRLVAAAAAETALTGAAVATVIVLAWPLWGPSTQLPFWMVALVLGICAAPSAAASLHASNEPESMARRVGDVDGLLSIAVGGAALALLREPGPLSALSVLIQASGVAVVIVLAAWLLIRTSSSDTERRVFTGALLLLLGGAADYLSLSALLTGLIAGLFLHFVGGPARDSVRRDVLHFQRPLLVLVLIVSGARLELEAPWLAVGMIYLLVRVTAKLAGGWAAQRVVGPAATPGNLGMSLLAPGILGVAFALNVVRAAGPDAEPMLVVAAVGAIGSDVIASFVRSGHGARE
jgi:hypothetical protein